MDIFALFIRWPYNSCTIPTVLFGYHTVVLFGPTMDHIEMSFTLSVRQFCHPANTPNRNDRFKQPSVTFERGHSSGTVSWLCSRLYNNRWTAVWQLVASVPRKDPTLLLDSTIPYTACPCGTQKTKQERGWGRGARRQSPSLLAVLLDFYFGILDWLVKRKCLGRKTSRFVS